MPDERYYRRTKHRQWREKVLRRDGYLCAECRKYGRRDREGNPVAATHAHHIRSVEEHPELRYVVSNGVSLCAACHNKLEPRVGIAMKKRGKASPHP